MCVNTLGVRYETTEDGQIAAGALYADVPGQAVEAGVPFVFRQTGANFVKDGRLYRIPRPLQHEQAQKAGLDFLPQSR